MYANPAPCLALAPFLLVAGCGHPHQPAKATADYFADASRCDKQTQVVTRIPINLGGLGARYNNANVGGGPMDIVIPLGADRTQYRVCMENSGWQIDPAKDPYFTLLETCRQKAKTSPAAGTPQKTKIGGGFDAVYLHECLKNRGPKGTVIVLPIRPANPE